MTLYVNSHLKNSKQRDFFLVPYDAPLYGRKWTITTTPDTQHTLELVSSPVTMLLVFFHWNNCTHSAGSSTFIALAMAWASTALLSLVLRCLFTCSFTHNSADANISAPNQAMNHLHSNAAGLLLAAGKWHSLSFLTK